MRRINLIFRKELRDMFRDRRVRTMALITPSLIIIMMMYLLGFVEQTVSKPSNLKIHIVKSDNPSIEDMLKKGGMSVTELNSAQIGEQMIQAGDARLVLEI